MDTNKKEEEIMNEERIIENLKFRQWFSQHWQESGGLITNTTAARLLNKTSGRISQMVKEGKLIEHRYNKEIAFLESPQIFRMIQKENKEIIETAIPILAKNNLPENLQESFIKTMTGETEDILK